MGKHFKRPYNPRCYFCNLFMSWRDVGEGITFTFYGDSTMLEPPDPEWAHRRCWKKEPEEHRQLIRGISWAKPYSNLAPGVIQ